MQKGQSVIVTSSAFRLPHGASIVLVPCFGGEAILAEVQPVFTSSFSNGGSIELSSLVNKVDKLHVISNGNVESILIEFNGNSFTIPSINQGEDKIRALLTLYRHNDQWKLRYTDEVLSDNEKLGKYLKVLKPIDFVSLCKQKHSALGSLREQASGIVNSGDASEVRDGFMKLGGSLKSEGVSLFNKMRGKFQGKIKEVKNESFLEAACAVSAIVAFADGHASQDEQAKLLAGIQSTDELGIYPSTQVHSVFHRYVAALRTDPLVGEGVAMQSISKFTNKPEAEFLVMLSVAIANAEDGVDADERSAIERIAKKLSVDVSDMLARV